MSEVNTSSDMSAPPPIPASAQRRGKDALRAVIEGALVAGIITVTATVYFCFLAPHPEENVLNLPAVLFE